MNLFEKLPQQDVRLLNRYFNLYVEALKLVSDEFEKSLNKKCVSRKNRNIWTFVMR